MDNRKSEVYVDVQGRFIIVGADVEPNIIELKDGEEIFGRVEEFTSRSIGAKLANAVRVTLWGPDILHRHRGAEETYICIQGQGQIFLDNKIYKFVPRTKVIIRPGILHAARPKKGLKKLVFACISSPAFSPNDVSEDPRKRNW